MLATDRALEPEKDQDRGHLTPFSVPRLEIMHTYGPPEGTRAGAQPSEITNHVRREYRTIRTRSMMRNPTISWPIWRSACHKGCQYGKSACVTCKPTYHNIHEIMGNRARRGWCRVRDGG